MTDTPRAQKPSPYAALQNDDLMALLKHFETVQVDYAGLKAMISKRFAGNPILFGMCNSFAVNMERLEANKEPQFDMQRLVAKAVLSLIVNTGRIAIARRFLKGCLEKWGPAGLLELDSILNQAKPNITQIQVLDKPWLDYQVHDRKSDTTLVLMCGNTHRFSVELNAVLVWLQPLPVNLVYLRDFHVNLYLAGVRSIGDLTATIERLKKDLGAIGTKRIVTMGNSAGAYGALIYADLLKADQVLCFAGPTSLDAGKLEASERPAYAKVEKLVAEGKLSEPNLRAAYEKNGIRVRYFYGADCEFDAAQTKTFEGLSNVTHEKLDGWSRHVVIGEMARRGSLHKVFAGTLA